MNFEKLIRTVPGFPKEGILFRDITTLLKDGPAYKALIDELAESVKDEKIDVIVGPEARGFVIGAPLAYRLGVGFVPVRKPGKLPADVYEYSYELEYGSDCLQMHKDAIKPGMRVLIADDLLATGGTILACCKLVEQAGGEVAAIRFAFKITDVPQKPELERYHYQTLMTF